MPLFTRQPPDAIYRGSIILGCFAFLLGVAGIFYFQHQDEVQGSDADVATVWVHGLEDEEDIQVVLRWDEDADGLAKPVPRSETGRIGETSALFEFERAPEGRPVELKIYRHGAGGRELLHEQIVILTYGQRTYTAVPLDPSAPK